MSATTAPRAAPKPAMPQMYQKPGGQLLGEDWQELRQKVSQRLESLRAQRDSWWRHWRELAEYILPRRYRWLVTPNAWQRGSPINTRILDATGTVAFRTLAAGLMSGVSSPSRPWFRLTVDDTTLAENPDVKLWLSDTYERMAKVLARSNYYVAKAVQYFDLVVFGTAPMIIYEDEKSVIKCFNPCAGEYMAAVGPNFNVDTLYREFTLTADQTCREFGYSNCSQDVKNAWDTRGALLDGEVVIGHAIEPNPDFIADGGPAKAGGVPRHFEWREIYWQVGASENKLLRVSGFLDQPFSCPRWDVTGNDAYGRSPAMDALGDIKQLQLEQKRKAQSIDKMVNPPMIASAGMKNEPASLLPGAVTYATDIAGGVGFKPVFQVIPPIKELKDDIQDVRARIKEIAFNDLFLMISQLDTVRTATEIDARREEKLIMLGPVLERNQTEGLNPDVDRVYRIMVRKGMLRPPPPAMRGTNLRVQYSSMLAQAQRATDTGAIERVMAMVGSVAGLVPQVVDNINTDDMIHRYADLLGTDPRIMNPDDVRGKIRDQRNAQQAQATALQTGQQAATAAETLSNTDVGGGQNALSAVINGTPGGGR